MQRVLIVAMLIGTLLVGTAAQAATPFTDVPAGHLFETEIEWMAAEGITQGCNPPTNDLYCPDDMVSRGQMAAFLVRALGLTDDGGGDLFTDDDLSIFEGDIDRLGTAGITQGCNPPTNDQYCPDDVVTRGQMAAFLYRGLAAAPDDPEITTTTLADTTVGAGYDFALTASSGTTPYTWSLDSGSLPTGIDLSTTGELTGNAQASGVFGFTVAVGDAVGGSDTADLTITVVDADLEITTTSLPVAVLDEPYDFQMEAIGGNPPYEWAITGIIPLPPDLVLSADGSITGTPQVGTGSGPIEFTVTDADATAITRTLTLTATTPPVEIDDSTPLPEGTTGEEYEAEVIRSGGIRPVTLTVVSGDLPPGVTMDTSGLFEGIPAVPGTFLFTVEAEDDVGTSDTAELTIEVNPGPMTVTHLVRANVESDGTEAIRQGNDAAVSSGGRYVVYVTDAALVAADTNGVHDIYRHDLQTGTTELVTVDTSGGPVDDSSWEPAVSATGRYVAFRSAASDLVSGDTNLANDIFVRDMQANTTTRVSVDALGAEADDDSYEPSISANGQRVAFYSDATNLVVGDVNGFSDVFVRDTGLGDTILISLDSTGNQIAGASLVPVISGDGSVVVFPSAADGVVPGDTNGLQDLFAVDVASGNLEMVSTDAAGDPANSTSLDPSLSYDGETLAFSSYASNLVAGDTNGTSDVYVKILDTGEVIRASVNGSFQSTGIAHSPHIAGEGFFVTFLVSGDELDPLDDNGQRDAYLFDILRGTVRRVSVRPDGTQGDNDVWRPSVSADGSRVVFESDATNLVDNDSNGFRDVFAVRLLVPPPS